MEAGVQAPSLYVFNPFTEAYFLLGKAFTPTKTQAQMAQDLCTIPQFFAGRGDLLLVSQPPQPGFLQRLQEAGFDPPEFMAINTQRIPSSHSLRSRKLAFLRPWAWGPDSLELLSPLLPNLTSGTDVLNRVLDWRPLYSKNWSSSFLRKFLLETASARALCTLEDCGETANDYPSAIEAIQRLRARGHHRVVAKQALGLAGQNALRLWEPQISEQQQRWLRRSIEKDSLVIEAWLDKEIDFSIQLEMTSGVLRVVGYTGLVNDLRGQYQGNWVEPGFSRSFPEPVSHALGPAQTSCLHEAYGALLSRLEHELQRFDFTGPLGIDALVYRAPDGKRKVKLLVEINPRYTMGRLALELMKRSAKEVTGRLRLVSVPQIKLEGFRSFPDFSAEMSLRFPLEFVSPQERAIRRGFLCLNDPAETGAVLAVFIAG